MRRSAEIDIRDAPGVLAPPEDLIISTVGYGRWQVVVTAILCLTVLTHVMDSSLDPIHQMAGWWCEKPETLRGWTNSQWIMFSHVNARRRGFTEKLITERFRGCRIYDYNFSNLSGTAYTRRPEIRNRGATRCAKVHYSQKFGKTVAAKFDKGCSDSSIDNFLWHFLTLLGQVLGYLVFGCLSDRTGRRPVLLAACGTTPLTGIALAFAPSYAINLTVRTLHGFFHGGFVVGFILLLETSSDVFRTRTAVVAAFFYGMGFGLTPFLFEVLPSVDHLTILINALGFAVLSASCFLPESPPWLFCTRNTARLENVIRRAARTNGAQLPIDFRVTYAELTDVRNQLPTRRPGLWSILQAPEIVWEIAGVGYLLALSGLISGSSMARLVYNEKRVDHWHLIIGLDRMAGIVFAQIGVMMMGHRRILQASVFLVLVTTVALMANLGEDYSTTTGPVATILAANIFSVSLVHGVILNYSVRTVPTLVRGGYLGLWSSLWATFAWLGSHRYLEYPGLSSTAIITVLLAALATLNFRNLTARELPDTVIDTLNFKDKTKPKRWALARDGETTASPRSNTTAGLGGTNVRW